MRKPQRIALIIVAVMTSISTLFCGYFYYSLYWRFRHCFTPEGTCFVASEGINYTDNAAILGPMLILPLLVTAYLWYRILRRPRV